MPPARRGEKEKRTVDDAQHKLRREANSVADNGLTA